MQIGSMREGYLFMSPASDIGGDKVPMAIPIASIVQENAGMICSEVGSSDGEFQRTARHGNRAKIASTRIANFREGSPHQEWPVDKSPSSRALG
jgi:hypothetical protein